jgi:hypothetical protein
MFPGQPWYHPTAQDLAELERLLFFLFFDEQVWLAGLKKSWQSKVKKYLNAISFFFLMSLEPQ